MPVIIKRWNLALTKAIIAMVLLASMASSCSVSDDETLAKAHRSGSIRIGIAIEPPYAYFDEQHQATGLEVEIAKQLTSRLGIPQVEFRTMDFNSLIDELNNGNVDVIGAGMYITAQRAKHVAFSEPTLHVRQALLVRSGNPHSIHSYEAIAHDGTLKVAVLRGSFEEILVRDLGTRENQIVTVPNALTARLAVENGLADSLALSVPALEYMIAHDDQRLLEVAKPFSQTPLSAAHNQGFLAMAFRHTDSSLVQEWNRQLAKFIGSPEHLEILAKYRCGPADLPKNVTTAQIIAGSRP